jgi:hypothetical protein
MVYLLSLLNHDLCFTSRFWTELTNLGRLVILHLRLMYLSCGNQRANKKAQSDRNSQNVSKALCVVRLVQLESLLLRNLLITLLDKSWLKTLRSSWPMVGSPKHPLGAHSGVFGFQNKVFPCRLALGIFRAKGLLICKWSRGRRLLQTIDDKRLSSR